MAVAAALGVPLERLLDLAQTLNPVAPDVRPLVKRHVDLIRHYPDTGEARAALAAAIGVDADQVLLTNGGAEAIALVAAIHRSGHVEDPEFSLYRRHLLDTSPDAPRWRSNPNNPLGTLARPEDHAAVWDEAFYPLATGTWTRGDALRDQVAGAGGAGSTTGLTTGPATRMSVAVGSLTKLFACPGLRLGYLIADPGLVADAEALQPRWSVNALAAAVLPTLLERCDLAGWSKQVAALRADLTALLEDHGLTVRAADAPWVLVDGVDDLRARLLPHHVLVRDCTSFGMAGVHRVAVPDEVGLERLARALAPALT